MDDGLEDPQAFEGFNFRVDDHRLEGVAFEEPLDCRHPVFGIQFPLGFLPMAKRLKYVPAPEDIDTLIALADSKVQDYLRLLRDTMARVSEVNRLAWDDVNLEQRFVVLYTRKKSGGHLTPRKVPMTQQVFDILSRRFPERDNK